MTVHVSPPLTIVEIFRARAEARALLWQAGEFTLIEAVDTLAAYATALDIDQDTAQRIMAIEFGRVQE